MRIMHVTTGLGDGGAEATLFRLILGSPDIEHCVVSLASGGRYKSELEKADIQVIDLGLFEAGDPLRQALKLIKIINDFEPDAIQSWMYHANFLTGVIGLIKKLPPVYWGIHHTNLIPGVDPWHTRLASSVCAKISDKVPARIVCAGHAAKAAHELKGYHSERLVVVPNGYDIAKFTPNRAASLEVRSALGLTPQDFLVGSVGRYAPQKDHVSLFHALARLKVAGIDLHCLLVGSGMDSSNAELVNLARALDILDRVHFLGSRNDVEKIMAALDVHVTSSAFGEAFPNVICEAMLSGTPCVTTDVGDAAFMVGKTGFVAQPSDPDSLFFAMSEAFHSHQERESWRARCTAARERVEKNFSLSLMVYNYRSLWKTG